MIQLARPDYASDDITAIAHVLESGHLTNGPVTTAFEHAIADYVGVDHAVAVSNGTVALVLTLDALGIGAGDEVLVPAFSYPATAYAVSLVGATPVFVDSDPFSWNMDAELAQHAITTKTRALIPIDQFGLAARLDQLSQLRRHDGTPLYLLEDAACALGAAYLGRRCGSGVPSACLSFHPRKVITTGEGGMILTDDAALADTLRRLRNHGRDRAGTFTIVGNNQRLSDLAAALGLSQLKRLDEILATKRRLAARYTTQLQNHPLLTLQHVPEGWEHSYQTFALCLSETCSRSTILKRLQEIGIQASIATFGTHRLAPYAAVTREIQFPVADRLTDFAIALPLHTSMTEEDVDFICRSLCDALNSTPSD